MSSTTTTDTSPLPNPSSPTATSSSSTATSTSTSAVNAGNPTSATLLFGFLVIFVAIFAAFLLLAILWQYRRRREAAAAGSQVIILEFDESKGTYRGVPRMWEVWIQHHEQPSGGHWRWENIRPLSLDIDNTSSGQPIAQASQSQSGRPRHGRTWPHNRFRRRPVPLQSPPPQEAQQQQQQEEEADVTSASAPVVISGVRMSFVIAMPNADAPTNRRGSVISQVSCARESWRHREFALGIYNPPFREDCAL